jgi:hypothetical protein
MSFRRADRFFGARIILAALCLPAGLGLPAAAQYVGKVTKDAKDSPELRSIAVLEWTGDEGNPTASRLVPITVLDAGELQDGGVYLARPQPLALGAEVEYELQQDGKPLGLFDVKSAGREDGWWVGFGAWKPMPVAQPKPAAKIAGSDFDDDTQSDTPVLHRKHHTEDAPSGKSAGSSGSGDASAPAAPSDPDRPVLHKKSGAEDNSNTGSTADPEQPTLHKKDPAADSVGKSADTSSDDPDRPTLRRPRRAQPTEDASAATEAGDTDPDRPRLKRGKPTGYDLKVAPSLRGFPADVRQTVAVSDAKSRPAHPWEYAWANPDDEVKMKSAMEDIARDALGLTSPPTKAAPKRAATASSRTSSAKRSAKAAAAALPATLDSEQFRVFELAYGSGATLVLTAQTSGPATQQKFVTIVAQPDLYGNVLVLLKNVTDGAHLDETPRMRLVDAVDAMADNRGELLFELRGSTQRQFALYRVLRGQAEKLFVTAGEDAGLVSSN